MKKPYQIESQRAVRQLEAMAADGNPAVPALWVTHAIRVPLEVIRLGANLVGHLGIG